MGPKSLGELLHALADLHKSLAEHYAACSVQAKAEEARVRLAHLCRIEQYIEHCVHEYAHSAPKELRETWLRTTPDLDAAHLVRLLPSTADASCEDLLDGSMKIQDEVEKQLTELIRLAENVELRDALECLLEIEKREKTKILRSIGFY